MRLDLTDVLPLPAARRPAAPVLDEGRMPFSTRNKPYQGAQGKGGGNTVMTPTGGNGSHYEFLVTAALARWIESSPGGIPFSATGGFRLLDGSCLTPDAAWISNARWNGLSPEEQDGYPPLCPDFLIELRPKAHSRRALDEKMHIWMQNGARLAWLIDPAQGSVTIYRRGEPEETLHRPSSVTAGAPVQGFVLKTAAFWPKL
jgi:Uma2 family endonuclease